MTGDWRNVNNVGARAQADALPSTDEHTRNNTTSVTDEFDGYVPQRSAAEKGKAKATDWKASVESVDDIGL